MNNLMLILGAILLLLFVIAILSLFIALRVHFCENECPHRKECMKHEDENDFVPPCCKHCIETPFSKDTLGF